MLSCLSKKITNNSKKNYHQQLKFTPMSTLVLPLGDTCCGHCGYNMYTPMTALQVEKVKKCKLMLQFFVG